MTLTLTAKVGGEGKLFGSIGTIDIADALAQAGHEVERAEVRLSEEGPLRELGDHEVGLHLHADVDVTITVAVVEAEQA